MAQKFLGCILLPSNTFPQVERSLHFIIPQMPNFFFPQKIRSLFCFSWYVLNPLLRWRWRHQNSPSPKKHHLVLGYGKLSLLCLFLPSLRIWGATVGDEPMFLKNISCLQTLSLFPVVFTGFACSNYFCEVFLIAWRHCFDTSMSSFI